MNANTYRMARQIQDQIDTGQGIIPGQLSALQNHLATNQRESQERMNAARRKAIETYDAQCTKNKRLNNEISSRYHEEHSEWEENQRKNMEDLKQPLILTKNLLNELYKKDLIYKKYQNLPALTSIYEYLLTGRCDSLTGPHGAYNLYEDEVRKDTVISQLNEVINNLEKIRANQYMLYQQIKTIQENTAEIGLELSRIRSNTTNIMELTAINAYYSALTARNTEVTAAYHLLS